MATKEENPRPNAADSGKVQGEGDYEAARRYDKKLREHVKDHDIDKEARDAEPKNPAEQRELQHAEQKGKDRAKGEDPLLEKPQDIESEEDDESSR